MKTGFVSVRGLPVEVARIPAARPGRPPLVLLHEGLGSIALWRAFPTRLAEHTGCEVVVFSRHGYGRSAPLPWPRTPRYMHDEALEALPELLRALGIERPVLVGHSDGGSIALIHAGAFAESVAGLVVLAPHAWVEEEALAGIRAAGEAWRSTDWPARLGRLHADPERVFRDWHDTWLSPAFRDWNIETSLPAIACPVLAIQGENDEYATMRQIEVIAERVPNTRLLKLPGCGHSPHREARETVVAAIGEWLAQAGLVADHAHALDRKRRDSEVPARS